MNQPFAVGFGELAFVAGGTYTVVASFSGDDGHNNCISNHTIHAGETDQPIGALMTDLKQRGLWDETLLVWGGGPRGCPRPNSDQ